MLMLEFYILFLLCSFLTFTGIKIFSLSLKRIGNKPLNLNELSVIIPVRNEAQNLPLLLNSILSQKSLPNEILFVNDHSSDDSEFILQDFIDKYGIGKLISLPHENSGKKKALALGIKNADSRFILTLDADIVLNTEYMNTMQKLEFYGLCSLPVKMKGAGFLENLFSAEYSFFNAFNYLVSPIWPISVSGANLLFDSKLVDYDKQLELHEHLASGDDYFLMKSFKKNRLPIHLNNMEDLSVVTSAPLTIKEYLDQRVRWLGKSKFQLNLVDVLIGLFFFIYFLGGIIALILALFNFQWTFLFSILVMRFLIDSFVYLNYVHKLGEARSVLILPFFQIVYPFLFIVIGVLSLFYKPKWKGRPTD